MILFALLLSGMFVSAVSSLSRCRKKCEKTHSGLTGGEAITPSVSASLRGRTMHWQAYAALAAIVARSKGMYSSSNIAPSTSTRQLATVLFCLYEGMPYFKPFEIFLHKNWKCSCPAISLFL
jgi:hypothetical protein